MLYDYFTNGTRQTITGSKIGSEVETDFVTSDGMPISRAVTAAILNTTAGRPPWCEHKLELGRQKLELAISPQSTTLELLDKTAEALRWLYTLAAKYGAYPIFEPDMYFEGELLYVTDERDAIWVELDGKPALEELCRCSSVQFTIDLNPSDAIEVINSLSKAKLHEIDFVSNNKHWQNYIDMSLAEYLPNRYGGPEQFESIDEYCEELSKNLVVMHEGKACGQKISELTKPNIDLFLRSVWWHYRLRRYSNSLTVEVRPFSRRDDSSIEKRLKLVCDVFGI